MKRSLLIVIALGAIVGGAWLVINRNSAEQQSAGQKTELSDSNTGGAESGDSLIVLNVSNLGLTSVGADIYNQTNVEELVLSGNAIKSLPSEIGRMVNVQVMRIDHNQLEGSLSGEIRLMSKLRVIEASYNGLSGVPAEIGQLKHLEDVDLSYNDITSLPDEISHLKNNLKIIDLTGNPLSQDQIDRLRIALPSTTVLF